MVEKTPNFLVK